MKIITVKDHQEIASFSCPRKLRTFLSNAMVFLLSIMFTSTPLYALPQGGQVSAGSAQISMPTTSTMQINQSSNKAVIDWRSYNVGQHETVNYRQPNASSISLNRIDPNQGVSKIFGSINANGQVWLINSAGIWFGATSHVNVGGLLATTGSISNKDFMDGNYRFQQSPNWNGAIENDGVITVREHGLAALVAPGVVNRGRIVANMGTVVLGASKKFTVDFAGDQLINFQVGGEVSNYATNHNGKSLRNAVTNNGTIIANGGKVMMTAQTAGSVLDHAINMRGYVQAKSVGMVNGQIILNAGAGTIRVSGKLIASGRHGSTGGTVKILANKININKNAVISTNGDLGGGSIYLGNAGDISIGPNATLTSNALSNGNGGQISLNATNSITVNGKLLAHGGSLSGNGGTVTLAGDASTATTELYGAIDVNAAQGTGGEAILLGKNVGLFANSSVNANGNLGGGNIFVGGNYHGEGPLPNATVVYFDPNAVLNANALSNGNGGQVILWADNTTRAYGRISAQGGVLGGNGGFVETSGHYYLDANGVNVNTLAPKGQAGTWLLDPTNIYIATNLAEAQAAGMTGTDTSAGTEVGGVFAASGALTQDSFLSIQQLQDGLLTGNVVITTQNPDGGTGVGNVIFTGTSALSWLGINANTSLTVNAANDITTNLPSIGSSTNQTLTFNAGRDININSQINVSQEANVGTGNIVMTAGRDITFGSSSSILSYGPITLTAGTTDPTGSINIGGFVSTDIGNLNAQAPGQIAVTGAIHVGGITPADVSLQAGTNITQTSGSVIQSVHLVANATTGINLAGANQVQVFTATNTTSGDLTFNDAFSGVNSILPVFNSQPFTGVLINAVDNTGAGGNISLSNDGMLLVNDTVKTSGAGNIAITTTGGNPNDLITEADVTTTTGNITLTSANQLLIASNITSSLANAGTTITGSAVGNTSLSTGGHITGHNVNLNSTIGAVSQLDPTSSINTSNLATTSFTGTTLTNNVTTNSFAATNNNSGVISLATSVANLTINNITQTGSGTVSVVNNGGNETVSGQVSASGTVALTATGTISGAGSVINSSNLSTISTGGVTLNGANAVTGFTANNSNSGNISLTNTANLTLGALTFAADPNGNISVNNTGTLTVANSLSTGGTINLISTGNMNVQQSITSPTGSITLNATGGSGTTIGAGTGTVNVSGASTVIGGVGTSGVINVTGVGVTLASPTSIVTTNNVNLNATSGGILENTGSTISANVLTANSAGGIGISLAGSNNTINTFNGTNTTTGNIVLTAGVANLAISGISETGGLVNITNTGNIATTGSITNNSSGQSIALTSTGGSIGIGSSVTASGTSTILLSAVNSAISETAGGLLTGAALTAHAANGINLGNANGVAQFTGTNTASGNINLVNIAPLLTVASVSQAGAGNIAINNTGALTTTGVIATTGAGTIGLTGTNGTVTIGANVTATSGNIGITSTGAANDVLFNTSIINTTGAIDINSGRDISLTTSSGAQIGTSNTSSVTLNAGRDVLTAAGTKVSALNNVTFNAGRNINSAGDIDPADVALTAVGTISQTGIVTANILTATSGTGSGGGDMLINNVNNDFAIVVAENQGSTGNINIIDNVNSLSINSLLQSNASNTAGTTTLQNRGGSLVLNGNVISQGGLITLANRQAVGDTFTNIAGVNAISGGTYHIWSYSPVSDQVGNLTNAPAFVQYNATYPATAVIGSGNGLLYKIAPTINVIAAANRTYNATTVINLTPANYSITTGSLNNDSLTLGNLNLATSTNTSSPNVGTYAINPVVTYNDSLPGVTGVNASGIPVGIPVYGYSVASSGTATITPAPLTASGVKANNKVYDGTTNASFNLSQTQLSGLFGGDSVSLDLNNINGQFATKNVGNAIPVNYAGLTISGADASNYFLTNTGGTAFASITPKPITVQDVIANSKVYDGTNGATLTFNCGSTGCLVGAIPGDNVALNQQQYNAIFSSTGPGNGIPVIVDLSLLGTDAGNYTITFPASAFIADIFAPSTQDVSSILQAAYLNEIGRPQAIANATDLMMMNSLNACRAHYKRHLNDSSFGIDFDCPTYKQLNRE